MTGAAGSGESPSGPILLLAAQGFALGLTTAWILIPASAIFLTAYGSELLPITYIGAAAAGIVSSSVLASAFRRRPLAAVATTTLAGLAVALFASWIVLALFDASWVSFALLVLVPIVVPVGFIFVVGQAGMLLDVRVLKKLYARVVAGFALGYVAGGLLGPSLLTILGTTESVLAAAAVAAVCFLAVVQTTRRRYPAQLAIVEHADVEADRPTLRGLTRNRFVMLIVAFQMLSAVESQWLDFHVLATAAERYEGSSALARFISQFTAIAYGTDILFLLVLAGWLLHRFGLRYGLTANAVGVLSVVVAIIVTTSLLGSGATVVFVLIVAARVTDLTFSDGTSRTSLSAAYQAVPTRMRAVTQATVEGLAVPLAIGASGVGLLVVQAVGGVEGVLLPVLTSIVVSAWVVVAVLLYREYRVNLLANLRGRALEPADLTVEEESGFIATGQLVGSDDARDVWLGLDILTATSHPDLPATLRRLVIDDRDVVRTDALERLMVVEPALAAECARDRLSDPSSEVRAAAIRALGAAGSREDLVAIAKHSSDRVPEVAAAVAVAQSRLGGDEVRARVAAEVTWLAWSTDARDRVIAALALRDVDEGTWMDRSTLGALLTDADAEVVVAALAAFRLPEDAASIVEVESRLDDRGTGAAALEALVRSGDAAVAVVDDGLRRDSHSRRAQEQLVRVGREIGGASAIAVLHRHFEHRDREIGLAVMRALAALGPSTHIGQGGTPAPIDDEREPTRAVVRDDLEHATHALRALVAFEGAPAAGLLCGALRDEFELIRRRVLAAFSMRHGSEGFDRVVFQLAQHDPQSHAIALEWLDVTLTGTDHAAIALLEPGSSDAERLHTLLRTFPLPQIGRRELLLELVADRDGRWRRPWVKACAIYTASGLSEADLDAVRVAALENLAADGTDEDRIVRETIAGIAHRRLDLV